MVMTFTARGPVHGPPGAIYGFLGPICAGWGRQGKDAPGSQYTAPKSPYTPPWAIYPPPPPVLGGPYPGPAPDPAPGPAPFWAGEAGRGQRDQQTHNNLERGKRRGGRQEAGKGANRQ